MNRRELILAGLAAGASARCRSLSSLAQGAPDVAVERQVDEALRRALEDHGCAGAQVAIAQRGTLRLSRGSGFANLATRTPVDAATVFRLGSLTKQFTAAIVLRLAARGRLDVRAPIARVLSFMAPLPQLSALELMNHSAGLHDDEAAPPLPGAPTQLELATAIAAQKQVFDFDPGTAWLYSNANYVMLGALIEAVTGAPLANAYRELATSLGLEATAMDHVDEAVTGRAAGYSQPEPPAKTLVDAVAIDIAQAGGAGALRGTARDLCRWHAALLDGRVLAPAELTLMLSPGRLRDGRLSGAQRFAAADASYGEVQYGCGLLLSPTTDPHPSILHYGYVPGFSAVLQTYLRSGVTMAVLCNADGNPALPFRAIRQAVVALDA